MPEEYTFPSVSTLAKKENWIYISNSILKNGRTALINPEGMEEEDLKKWQEEMAKKDPVEPKLKSIALDS